jgi:hypothetical protein
MPKGLKELDIKPLTDSLQILIKYNPNLLHYAELLENYQNVK